MLDWLSWLELREPKILDCGCGTGWFSRMVVRYGDVTGIDLTTPALHPSEEQTANLRFVEGDFLTYPFESNVFDVVISQQVIAHVPNQRAYLAKIADILRPGGYLLLSTNNPFVIRRMGDFCSHESLGHIENWLDRKQLKRLLKPFFDIVRERNILPMGNRGILRLINSRMLNRIAALVIGELRFEQMKERVGAGYINVVLARRKN